MAGMTRCPKATAIVKIDPPELSRPLRWRLLSSWIRGRTSKTHSCGYSRC